MKLVIGKICYNQGHGVGGSYGREKKMMGVEKNGILGNFRCVFYCRKSVELIKREKIVDFKVRISATHQVTELRWLQKPMVVPKLTGNGIQ